MKEKMYRVFGVVVRNTDRLLKLVQIAVLLWIGFKLQNISDRVYSGPGLFDSTADAIYEIGKKLEILTNVIITK